MASGQFAVACRQLGRLFGSGTAAGLAEGPLLDRFVTRRDPAAFEAIVARHGPMVLAVCRSLLRDPNDVDDAFQAAFLVLVKRAESVRNRDLLGPWLHGVARRVALRARAESARRRDRAVAGPEPMSPILDDLDRLDTRAAIHAEVDRLPAAYRDAVVLCYLEGHTHEEAAQELGWPVGTVRGRLARARDLLRGRLARRGVGLTSGALLAALARESEAAVPGVLLESTTRAAAVAAAGPLASAVVASAIGSSRALALAQGALPTMTATKLKLAATLVVVGLLAGPGAAARSPIDDDTPSKPKVGDGPSSPEAVVQVPTTRPDGPAPKAAETDAEERLRLAEAVLADRLRMLQAGELRLSEAQMDRWNSRVLGARIEAGRDQAEAFRSFVETSRKLEAMAKTLFERGAASKVDLATTQFDRIEAEEHTRQVWALPPGPIQFPLTTGGKPRPEAIAKVESQHARPADTSPKPETPAPPQSRPNSSARERLKTAEEAVAYIQQQIDHLKVKGDPAQIDTWTVELNRWKTTADEARHELGGPDPNYLGALRTLEDARAKEERARKQYESGRWSKLDYLNAQLARVQAQEQVDRWAESLQAKKIDTSPAVTDGPGSKPGTNPGPGPRVKADEGDGGLADSNPSEPPRPRKLPKPHPADADRDKVIEQALEKTFSLDFPKGTPLDEVLTFIRDHTKDPKSGLSKGVPIYVDPIVQLDTSASRPKPLVTIAPITLDDIPLRVALRLVLDQFSLSYQVRDRMVYIIDEDLLDFRSEGASDFHIATGSRTPLRGIGGGMGGMGGGMGGMGGGMGGGGTRGNPGGMM